jgi:SnoaL-like domain
MVLFPTQGMQATHSNAELIGVLYTALRNADANSAASCYTVDASFRDIAFQLKGRDSIRQMWRLVCSRHVKVSFDSISADDRSGSGHWTASYTFTETNRKIDNDISSNFIFRDGLILNHVDRCSAMAWASQAYPFPKSVLAGLFGPLRRWKARKLLNEFIRDQSHS